MKKWVLWGSIGFFSVSAFMGIKIFSPSLIKVKNVEPMKLASTDSLEITLDKFKEKNQLNIEALLKTHIEQVNLNKSGLFSNDIIKNIPDTVITTDKSVPK